MNNHSATNDLLDFYIALEYLSPQKIERKKDLERNGSAGFVEFNKRYLPWQSPPKNYNNKLTYYKILFGIFKHQDVLENLTDALKKSADIDDEERIKTNDIGAIFSVILDENGVLMSDSLSLSAFPWAYSIVISNPDKFKIGTFNDTENFILSDFKEYQETNFQDKPLKYNDFIEILSYIADKINLVQNFPLSTENMLYWEIFYASREFDASNDRTSEFLNSFIAKEITRVSQAVSSRDIGTGLKQYLNIINPKEKSDILKDLDKAKSILSPENYPQAIWPDADKHTLVHSQQLAINAIYDKLLNSSGIFSVNGPPGTGKTTLLRDIIAMIIVERAKAMITFKHPELSFHDKSEDIKGSYFYKQSTKSVNGYALDLKLKNFGIVVASSNNGAVENITEEIPVKKTVAQDWFDEYGGYFTSLAEKVHGKLEKPAWGMIAAKLGNTQNRREFLNSFWKEKGDENSEIKNLDEILSKTPFEIETWDKAIEKFKESLEKENFEREWRTIAYKALNSLAGYRGKLKSLLSDLEKYKDRLNNICIELSTLIENKSNIQSQKQGIEKILDFQKTAKPFCFSEFFKTKRWKEWNSKYSGMVKQHDDIVKSIKEFESEISGLESDKKAVSSSIAKLNKEIPALKAEIFGMERDIKSAAANLKDLFPDENYWNLDESKRELLSPWHSAKWQSIKSEVFARALKIHELFLIGGGYKLKSNLKIMMDWLDNKIDADSSLWKRISSDIWDTFFMAVPVISTTFSSLGRLFNGIDKESIGWLLIDEAGQATPQNALGAIYRSKRSIVVGDPLQLEPVAPLPTAAIKTLSGYYNIDYTEWAPPGVSAQIISDRANNIGTYISSSDKKNSGFWIGSPLRVHRRCKNPMFNISNKIAYDGLMVHSGPKNNFRDETINTSTWWDIDEEPLGKHYINGEGIIFLNLIREANMEDESWYAITPFKEIAYELQELLYKNGIKNKGKSIGTVHTFQGKEADIVFIILGTGKKRAEARSWATSTPNLFNVAVTRAKLAVHVIGSKKLWGKMPYTSTILKELTVKNYIYKQ